MATLKRIGFGQVEPNHLSAPRNGQVYAQLPAKSNINILENGQFVKYDYATGECNFTGDGEWYLVYNEEKLYDERKQAHKDWAMQKVNYVDGVMTPRVFAVKPGDIYTTNCFEANTSDSAETTGVSVAVNNYFTPGTAGYLVAGTTASASPVFKVVKYYTMPDGQDGVKLQCIK